ncbi:MAG: hypothetical protein AAF494_00795 [Pseudomonadota bacterium]
MDWPEQLPQGRQSSSATVPSRHRPRRTTTDRVRDAVMLLASEAGALLTHEQKAWASITFSGTRHELVISFVGLTDVEAG